MVALRELVEYTNGLLNIADFEDYAPNGLQVEGHDTVTHIVSGVTASLALLEAAVRVGADCVLVHHGYFWRGEDSCITGMKHLRIRQLLSNDINLMAYHLPLDAHPQLGNNAQLASILGFNIRGKFGRSGKTMIALHGELTKATTAAELSAYILHQLGRQPLHIAGRASTIKTIAWCTGAAQDYLDEAVRLGVDAYLTGEISEQTTHIARETGVHFFAAGHHATERYGVQALGVHLAEKYGLKHQFIDIDNPV